MYSSKNSNPFLDDDEIPSSSSSSRGTYKSRTTTTGPGLNVTNRTSTSNSGYGQRETVDPVMDRRAQLRMQIDESEDRQLASTERAIASIYDSERMGIATAEELVRQGEQLDNIEEKNTEMTQMMTTSQKHLNNIKSVFGGIKNWWSGGKKETTVDEAKPRRLRETVERERETGTHPALKLKSDDGHGLYNNEDDLDSRFMANSRRTPAQQHGPMIQKVTNSDKEKRLDKNLDLMSDGMSKLKMLALDLGDEIETQNTQLDRINVKVDKNEGLLDNQNRQMRKILYK